MGVILSKCAPLVVATLALAGTGAPAHAQQAPAAVAIAEPREEQRLAQLIADDNKREEQITPLNTLYEGEQVDPRLLQLLFTDTLERRALASARQTLRGLQRIDRSALGPERQISFDVLTYNKQEAVRWLQPDIRALTGVRPFNHFGGLHVEFPSLMGKDGAINYGSEADYRRALQLDGAFEQVLDNAVARFRQGMASGVTESKLTVTIMIAQIDALLAQPVEQSPFYAPVLEFPAKIPQSARAPLRSAYAAMISDRINPAYARLRAFLANEYLLAARNDVGLSAMPGGPMLYRMLVQQQTTLAVDPDDVHRLGLSEVARIQSAMEGVKRELGYRGTLRDFFDNIRIDPRYHPRTKEDLAVGFDSVARKVDAQIPRFFNHVPRTKLLIQPYPAYREKYEAGGSYAQGSADTKRPGIFFYNTYDLPSRFTTGIATLYLHEGVPGHHFQGSLSLENESLPSFQRFEGPTAYFEGWALYAETLGFEMGLYKDPMQHWGTLDDEMLRAMRLVVDTGLHTKGWSREAAIDYMLANSGMGRSDATAEVERYIANPAQALAYKIGALTIQRLRRKAETALSSRFDIRAFHDQILRSGALPMPILEAKIDRWIAGQR